MTSRDRTKLVGRNAMANATLAAWLIADGARGFVLARDLSIDVVNVVIGLALCAAAIMVVFRPPPIAEDIRASSVIIALGAAFTPVALQMLSSAGREAGSFALVIEGIAVTVLTVSILYLGRNLSLVPQYRSLVSSGPYALIRHPMYSSYLLFDGALAVESQSWVAGGLWFVEAILLLLRAQREENLLAANDPGYASYLASVRYRFVPMIV